MAKSYGTFWIMRRQAEKLAELQEQLEILGPSIAGAVRVLNGFKELQLLAEKQSHIYDERCNLCGEDHPDDECQQRERAGRWGGHQASLDMEQARAHYWGEEYRHVTSFAEAQAIYFRRNGR